MTVAEDANKALLIECFGTYSAAFLVQPSRRVDGIFSLAAWTIVRRRGYPPRRAPPSPCHTRAITTGQPRSTETTRGPTSAQFGVYDPAPSYDSQAEYAGPIPVIGSAVLAGKTRIFMPPPVRQATRSRIRPV